MHLILKKKALISSEACAWRRWRIWYDASSSLQEHAPCMHRHRCTGCHCRAEKGWLVFPTTLLIPFHSKAPGLSMGTTGASQACCASSYCSWNITGTAGMQQLLAVTRPPHSRCEGPGQPTASAQNAAGSREEAACKKSAVQLHHHIRAGSSSWEQLSTQGAPSDRVSFQTPAPRRTG